MTTRELSALVAEKIMGWENNFEKPHGTRFPFMYGIMDYWEGKPVPAANFPNYAEDLEAAMEVVEEIYNFNKMIHFNILRTHDWAQGSGTKYGVSFFAYMGMGEHLEYGKAICDTLPEAICRAALITVQNLEKQYGLDFVKVTQKGT